MRIDRPLSRIFPCSLPRWLRAPVKRFRRDQDGVTAVEFGLIALPFFAILMAIIEAGLFFFVSQVMDTGFRESARLVRTGQAAGTSQTAVRDQMCSLMNKSSGLFTCASLFVEVRELSNYSSAASVAEPVSAGNFTPGTLVTTTSLPCGGKIVLMRAYYEWPSFANLLGSSLSNLNNNNILLSSAAVFINEPFGGC